MIRPGFTLIELLIVIAVFAVAAATTLPFLGSFQQNETVPVIADQMVQTLREAQQRAMYGELADRWGVRFGAADYDLYAGRSYNAREPRLDRRHELPRTVRLSGPREVNFLRSGEPAFGSGTILLQSAEIPPIRIAINEAGGIFLVQDQ